ncbi:MAG: hypothetical protein A3G41_01885 [Elusimicrobia bacterium RIFCSPLOWO2_12_FULL_59_9]|nr:MAG: hypothetical protein A3G41_01885 [Elusimicrobia bacterium RIFCSPLOWO2_12_FULL_59_9]
MALRVHRDGSVEVRAPRFVKQSQVRRFVAKRADWILERQRYFQELLRKHPGKELKNGETFPLLGRNFRLRLERRPGLETPYCLAASRRLKVFVDGQVGAALRTAAWGAIRNLYSDLTERKARAVIRKHSKALAVTPGKLKISDQAKRWASCSKSGDIRCNWRLSMMPISVLEYVVVHELCHLKTHDHSPQFWRILKSVLPDYEKRREWLRKEGPALAFGGGIALRMIV